MTTRIEKAPSVTEISSLLSPGGASGTESDINIYGESKLLGYDVEITHADGEPDAGSPPKADSPAPAEPDAETPPAPEAAAEPDGVPARTRLLSGGILLPEAVVESKEDLHAWSKQMNKELKDLIHEEKAWRKGEVKRVTQEALAKGKIPPKTILPEADYIKYYRSNLDELPEGYANVDLKRPEGSKYKVCLMGKRDGNTVQAESLLLGGLDGISYAQLYKNDNGDYILKTSRDGHSTEGAFAIKVTDNKVVVCGSAGDYKFNEKDLEKYFRISEQDVKNYIELLESNQAVKVAPDKVIHEKV